MSYHTRGAQVCLTGTLQDAICDREVKVSSRRTISMLGEIIVAASARRELTDNLCAFRGKEHDQVRQYAGGATIYPSPRKCNTSSHLGGGGVVVVMEEQSGGVASLIFSRHPCRHIITTWILPHTTLRDSQQTPEVRGGSSMRKESMKGHLGHSRSVHSATDLQSRLPSSCYHCPTGNMICMQASRKRHPTGRM